MVDPELIAGLCTALTFACSVQILITCFLAFAFSQFMSVLNCDTATTVGVLSGLVTVPTVIQLRASQTSFRVGRKYGYTILYKRLAIGTCALLQTVTWFFTIVNISAGYSEDTFLNVMKEYSKNKSSKSIVDNIQWFLQCCGADSYRDWYDINWGGLLFDTINKRRKKTIKELLFGNTDDYPDLSGMRNDVVPFSCCAENADTACVHQNLEQLGTYTINTVGCTGRLVDTKQSILWTEFVIYSICLGLEIIILYLLMKTNDTCIPETILPKCFHSDRREFSKFLNQCPKMTEINSH